MRSYRCASKIRALAGGLRQGIARFERDDSGAILLLGLAGILILMMLAWVLYDTGQMARDKMDVQTSADTAAYSQAAVKARAMNNIAYANVAKRSVVGIHSQYWALWQAYSAWYEANCKNVESETCLREREIYEAELNGDFRIFENHNSKKYFLQDVIAIDSYQRYTHALAPWWGWAEMVHRSARNGATMAASFPAPTGGARGNAIISSITNQVINAVGWAPTVRYTGHNAGLPVQRADYEYLSDHGMDPSRAFYSQEFQLNKGIHRNNSEGMAASATVTDSSFAYMPEGVMRFSKGVFGNYGRPWTLYATENPALWTTRTSNLVMTYRHHKEIFEEMRQKYDYMVQDYELRDEEKFRSNGYWGMARAEISFEGGFRAPDLWHPRWTARLRPVALPGEFQLAGIQMSSVYHDLLPYLAMSAILINGNQLIVNDALDDLVFMERASRAMGHSTVEGISK